jgi:mannose-6-phosphate isomerase
LHDLWSAHRAEIFGDVSGGARFPLLIKLLDAQEKLSLQVHPPAAIAAELDGEAKTEFWYIAEASPTAELFVGLRHGISRAQLEAALDRGAVAELVHAIPVRTGDAMFLPSGRLHAVGAGNVIMEIMENSDTTYRVFDWNRRDDQGQPRELHIEQAMRSIDFEDYEPKLVAPRGECLVRDAAFEVEKWNLAAERVVSPDGRFAIVGCLSGEISCAGRSIQPGGFFLLPASLRDRTLTPRAAHSSLLRITIPG